MHDDLIILWPEDLAELGLGDVPPIVAEPYEIGRRLDGSRLKKFGQTLKKLGKRIIGSPIVQAGATAAIGAFAGPAGAAAAQAVFGAVNGGAAVAQQAATDARLLTAPGMVPVLEELVRQAPATAPYVAPFLATAKARAAGQVAPVVTVAPVATVGPVAPLRGVPELSFAARYF